MLTGAGHALAPVFAEAFDGLGRAIHALKSLRPQAEIHIAALPSVAQLWLSDRLAAMRLALGDLRLSVTALETPPNLERDLFDLSLFLAVPTGAAGETVLAQDRIFPVCAPQLAAGIRGPADLFRLPRLLDQSWEEDWDLFSRALGLHLPVPANVARYSLYSLTLEEARAGAGVLIGHACLVERALARGDLVRQLPDECETGKALLLRTAPGAAGRQDVRAVRTLLAQDPTGLSP